LGAVIASSVNCGVSSLDSGLDRMLTSEVNVSFEDVQDVDKKGIVNRARRWFVGWEGEAKP